MKKTKIILITVIVITIIVAVVLYMIPWGGAESEIKELEITVESQKVESETGVEINDIAELSGSYTTYDMDSATSELMFSVDALQGTVGKFKDFKVEFTAGDNPFISVEINPNSIYTANRMRDEALRDEGFFEIKKFPSIVFKSSSIEVTDSNYIAIGTIKMLGTEVELTVPFTYKGKTENYKGKEVAIFDGKFTIDRTNYGMEHTASVGDNVTVNFTVQLEKQNE